MSDSNKDEELEKQVTALTRFHLDVLEEEADPLPEINDWMRLITSYTHKENIKAQIAVWEELLKGEGFYGDNEGNYLVNPDYLEERLEGLKKELNDE